LAVGMLFHAILNVVETYRIGNGTISIYIYDFWTKEITLATYQSTLMTMATAVAVWLVYAKKSTFKLIGVIVLGFEFMVAATIGSRSTIAIILFIILFSLIFFLCASKVKRKIKFWIIFLSLISLFLCIVAFNVNLFGIKDTLEATYLWKRFELRNSKESSLLDLSSRITIYEELLLGIRANPFGGIVLTEAESAHNTFLDIVRIGGVPAVFFFLAYIVSVAIKILSLIQKYGVYNQHLFLVTLELFAIGLIFMVESVFVINKTLIYGLILCCGVIDALPKYMYETQQMRKCHNE